MMADANRRGKRLKKIRHRGIKIGLTAVAIAIILIVALYKGLQTKPVISENELSPVKETNDINEVAIDVIQSDSLRKEDCYTFIFAASDQSSGNADVIILATFDVLNGHIGMVSVPRDTLINPADGYSSYPKINSTYYKGIDNLEAAVSDLFGIPIDYYVTVDIDGFVSIIDSLDGIDFNVPVHMSYDDPVQDLSIHYEPGLQHLSGKQVLEVCRLRHNDDGTIAYEDYDIGRTKTQQEILKVTLQKVMSNPQKIKKYIQIFKENVKTNLTFGNLLWLMDQLLKIDIGGDIEVATLPGDGTATYGKARYCYALNEEETLQIINQKINPYTQSLSLDEMNIFQGN